MKGNVEDIFFDLDHTLWDFERNSSLAYEKIFKKHQLEIVLSDFLEAYIPINKKYWQLYSKDEVSKADLRFYRLYEAFTAINYHVKEEVIHLLADDYILCLPDNNYLFEGAIETLDYLKQNYNLHVITNGFEDVQNLKLKKSNISHFFKTVMTSEEAGVKKPNIQIFEKALLKAKAKKETSIMVGDNLEADIYGAENAGIKAIYYNPCGDDSYKGMKINTLTTLQNLL